MPYDPPVKCPVCGEELHAERLRCSGCNTAVEGDFTFSALHRLTKDQRDFAVSFIKTRGSIKAMEKLYGISYPTVRGKIDELIAALGEEPIDDAEEKPKPIPPKNTARIELLRKLASGELDENTVKNLLEG